MGSFDRFYDQPREYVAFESAPIRPKERVMRLPGATPTANMRRGDGAGLDLVYEAAKVMEGLEDRATEIEKTSYQQLHLKERRIEELETELRAAQALIALDIVEHVSFGLIPRSIQLACYTLGLQRGEEALHRRIVPDIA